ncbi:MAG: hypothetical protein WCV85_06615 [Patescibacteria group bacterium]|jgi:hypothetical protein
MRKKVIVISKSRRVRKPTFRFGTYGVEFTGLTDVTEPEHSITAYIDSVRLIVNMNRSIGQYIAAGKYGNVDPEIHEVNFPRTGGGTHSITLKLVQFDTECGDADDVRWLLEKCGYRPANLQELLAFGEQRKILCERPIFALNSVSISPGKIVPYIRLIHQKPWLCSLYLNAVHCHECVFAAVPNSRK